ncbi:HVO_0234 family beta-propeller protein, partial [Natronobacterium gregoryi]
MLSIEEKRVYGDRDEVTEAYVSSPMGVVRVRIAGDTVGEFSLCNRCD